jgi:crotonobetainyl-CoA:carnitine CoA-transferase CaiB-like acyl-CoA transferase
MLSAHISAKNTGRGQVVDVSQFEAQARVMRDAFTMSSLGLAEVQRCGTKAIGFQPWDLFTSRDGIYVSIGAVGKSVFERFMTAAGLDLERYPYEKTSKDKNAVNSPEGRELDRIINEWCASHTADEIEEAMRRGRVPCARVNDAVACMKNEHYLSRGDFVNFIDQTTGIDVTAFGIAPKMSASPGMVWRGGPKLGQDTDEILTKLLGYDEDRIAAFHEKKII